MTNQELFLELFARYTSGEITAQEYRQLQSMIHLPEYESLLDSELKKTFAQNTYGKTELPLSTEDFIKGLQSRMDNEPKAPEIQAAPKVRTMFTRRKWIAAAAILMVVATGAYYFMNSKDDMLATETPGQNIAPGTNKAILQLANGSTIELSEKGDMQLPADSGVKVIKHGSELSYMPGSETAEVKYNKIITPAAAQYRLTLADGTKVWLDALSSIYFPTAFNGKDRVVEVTGQAYFEVAKDVQKPFKVIVKGSLVEVLGTSFNINAYDNESSIKTTLLEGAVRVVQGDQYVRLRPGQQSQINENGGLKTIIQPNLEETMAWKDGQFRFDGADIETIMRQISRWYDVQVDYKDNVHGTFVAKIPRDVPLSDILQALQLTNQVAFEVRDKKITVLNGK